MTAIGDGAAVTLTSHKLPKTVIVFRVDEDSNGDSLPRFLQYPSLEALIDSSAAHCFINSESGTAASQMGAWLSEELPASAIWLPMDSM
jgi:hypothetical protein